MILAAILLAAQVQAVVLGVAQDGGLPHLGCDRARCEAARSDPARALRVASIGLVVPARGDRAGRCWILDATPDLPAQVDMLHAVMGGTRPAGLPVDGIFLTHAHIGHYTGLMYLGREVMAARGVPVWATARMGRFLRRHGPWRRLVQGEHIALERIAPGRAVRIDDGLSVEPLRVPHREEESDVVGFLVHGPRRRLLYIPDIDAWGRWDRDIADVVRGVDVALLDATFYSADELPGRPMSEIPHPLVTDTMDRLEPLVREGRRVILIHLNHTNPALDADGPERREVERRGFEVAHAGMRIDL